MLDAATLRDPPVSDLDPLPTDEPTPEPEIEPEPVVLSPAERAARRRLIAERAEVLRLTGRIG